MKKTVIIIAGPTAVGKTAIGIAVARHFGTEIISADSRQCYRELNIGVARPTDEELAAVPHHFIASHSILQKVTAATFEEYALDKAAGIFRQNDKVVMVGGTGLYLKAFAEGMDPIPQVPEDLHREVTKAYQENGLSWLQQEVERLDPAFFRQGEIQNPQRLMRALEVVKATGQSVLMFRTGAKKERDFRVIKIALELPKDVLHDRIARRVENMITVGLVDEVRSLLPHQDLNALQTVGYKEVFNFLQGESTLSQAMEDIKKNTRQYAKRQLTWFRKDKDYRWFPPVAEPVITHLRDSLIH